MKIVVLHSFLCVTYPLVVANKNRPSLNENITSSNIETKTSRFLRKYPFVANNSAASDPWLSTQNMQLPTRGIYGQLSTLDMSSGVTNNQVPKAAGSLMRKGQQQIIADGRLLQTINSHLRTDEPSKGMYNQLAAFNERLVESWNQIPASSENLAESWNQLPGSSENLAQSWNQLPVSGENLVQSWNQLPASNKHLLENWNQPLMTDNASKGTPYQTQITIENLVGNLKSKQGISLKKDKVGEPGSQVLSRPDPSSLNRPLLYSLPARISQNAHGTLMKANRDPVPSTKVSGPLSSETSPPMKHKGPEVGTNLSYMEPTKQNNAHHTKAHRIHVSGGNDVHNETKIPAVMYNKDDYTGIPAKSSHETKTNHSGQKASDGVPASEDGLNNAPQLLQHMKITKMEQLGLSRPSINRNSHTTDHKQLMKLLQELRRPATINYPGSYSFNSQASTIGNSDIPNQMDIHRVGYPVELENSIPVGMSHLNYEPSQGDSTGNQPSSKTNTPIRHISEEATFRNNSAIFDNYQNDRQSMGSVLKLLPSHLGQHHPHPAGITSDNKPTLLGGATANPTLSEALGLANTRQSQEDRGKPARGSAFGEGHGNILTHLSDGDGPQKNVFMEVFEQVMSKDEMETNPLVKQLHNRFESQLNTLETNALSNPSFGFLIYFILPFAVIAVLTFTLLGVAPEYLGLMGLLIPGFIMATLLNDHGGHGRSNSEFRLWSGKSNAIIDDIHRILAASLDYYDGNDFSDVNS